MCMGGGGSPKVETPKPPPLPPPLPPPPAPAPAPPPPQKLQEPDAKPDIRIGAAKTTAGGQRNRNTQRSSAGPSSLSIGDSQGLKL